MDGQVLSKPLDAAEATTFLERLSGREHQVMTACAILHGEKLHSFVETTRVRFRELEATEIAHYVQSGLPMDKAGAYGIQEWIGLIGITRIEGSYQNVVGLPTAGLYAALKTHFPDIVRNTALKRHFPFSMVTLMAILLTGLLFSACGINQQASALKALRNCKFELVGVDSLTLAGTDLSPLLKGENINLSRVPAIAFGYLNQNLPLAASMQLQVENPTKKLAGIRQFQYVVLLDNTEILDGTSDLALEVPAGTTTVTPVRLQANIYKLITNGDNLQKLLAFLSGKAAMPAIRSI